MVDTSSLAGVMAASGQGSAQTGSSANGSFSYDSTNASLNGSNESNQPLSRLDTLTNQPTAEERLRSAPTQLDTLSESDLANDETSINAAIAAAQGTSAFVAREGIGAANARNAYNEAVSNLLPGDIAGRTQVKAAAREATPPVTRAAIQAARPNLGPRAGSVSSANKSNAGANRLAGRLGRVGKVGGVAGVVIGGARIATADNKLEESARVGGGVLGGIGGGALVGAQLGALGANPITIGVGAIGGAIIGGIAGEAAVDKAMSWAKSWF